MITSTKMATWLRKHVFRKKKRHKEEDKVKEFPVKGLYEQDDKVEEFLVNQVAKFIRYEKLRLFAKDLKIKERELEKIMAPNISNPHDRITKVSK